MTNKPKTGADLKPAPVFLEKSDKTAAQYSQESASEPTWVQLHKEACRRKQESYIDPETGFHVLTSYYLKLRGYCCKNKCRHCPYEFHKDAWPYLETEE